jgi:serine/threonine-protein kinase
MSAPVREGEVLAGKYKVERVLGVGGMGVVVAAWHMQLDERVALKFLLPEMLSNTEAVARFRREARAAVKIKSEHIARVIDVGELENGAPYMVMEFLEGGDLATWLQERGALPVDQAVEFVLQACEAIAEAHSLGIVHRDLKPANLFWVRRADALLSIKVLDFGISKVTRTGSGSDSGMTKTQGMMGSPLYMSPEQMKSAKTVDPRSDIWALGVILYEFLAGQPPFTGESIPELVLEIASTEPRPVRELRAEVPDRLAGVIARCLAKDRDQRWQNVAELAMALAEFAPARARGSADRVSRVIEAAGLSVKVPPAPPVAPTAVAAGTAGTIGSWGRTSFRSGRRRTALRVAAPLAVIAIAASIFAFMHHSPEQLATSAPTGSEAAPAPPPSSVAARDDLPAASTAAQPAVIPAPPVEPSALPAAAGDDTSDTPRSASSKKASKPAARKVAAPAEPPPRPAQPPAPRKYDPLDHL